MKYLVAREGIIDRAGEMFGHGSLALNHGKKVHVLVGSDYSGPPIGSGILEYDNGLLYIIVDEDSKVGDFLGAVPCVSYGFVVNTGNVDVLEVVLCGVNADESIQAI